MPSVNRTPTMSIAERRTRLARRHHLAAEAAATDATTAARSLIGLHATDPATIFLSARARVPGLTTADVEAALYDELTLVKHLCMRRTMFVVPDDLLAVVHVACTERDCGAAPQAARRRRRAGRHRARRRAMGARRRAHDARRPRRRGCHGCPAVAPDPRAAGQARLRRGQELGRDDRCRREGVQLVGGGRTDPPWPAVGFVDEQPAQMDIGTGVRSGPADRCGRPCGARASLAVGVRPGDARRRHLVDGTRGRFGAHGARRHRRGRRRSRGRGGSGSRSPTTWCRSDLSSHGSRSCPSLDPTTMGWKRREWYVGEHAPMLFDRNGNAGPTVWSDARIVGGWSQRPTGEVVVQLLEDVGSNVAATIASETASLQAWLGDTVVTARFPTPIDRTVRAPMASQPTRTATD